MTDTKLPLDLFDYELPQRLIAQAPARPRDSSRLLVMRRGRPGPDGLEHRRFSQLPELLGPGDLLVVNRTQVIPARLHVQRPTGGRVELLLFRPLDGTVHDARRWRALGKPGKALGPGAQLTASGGQRLHVTERHGEAVEVQGERPLWELLCAHGEVPLPPYIHRPQAQASDASDYQTIFARELGAVAAPTASLHFTDAVLEALRARGVEIAELVLHVGPGTFLPVRSEHQSDVRQHAMHGEWYAIPPPTLQRLEATQGAGRVVAVGTTVVRALETWAASGEPAGESHLFIYPGFEFRITDALVTNFHLPRSTLLMLVSAFAGRERILAAYAEAVRREYRFFSYGDAMLLC